MDVERVVSDYTLISSLERNIQVAIEFIVDLSNYILSSTCSEVPDTYEEIVSKVGSLCSIDKELVREIRSIVGLRNIIVYMYADIKYDIVLEELDSIINNMLKITSILFKCIDKLSIDL